MSNVTYMEKYRPKSVTYSYYITSNGRKYRPKIMVDELAFCLGLTRREIEDQIVEWYNIINKRSN